MYKTKITDGFFFPFWRKKRERERDEDRDIEKELQMQMEMEMEIEIESSRSHCPLELNRLLVKERGATVTYCCTQTLMI